MAFSLKERFLNFKENIGILLIRSAESNTVTVGITHQDVNQLCQILLCRVYNTIDATSKADVGVGNPKKCSV